MAPLSMKKAITTKEITTLNNGMVKIKIPISIIHNSNNNDNITSQNRKIKFMSSAPTNSNDILLTNQSSTTQDTPETENYSDNCKLIQSEENNVEKEVCMSDSNKENSSSMFCDTFVFSLPPVNDTCIKQTNDLLDNQSATSDLERRNNNVDETNTKRTIQKTNKRKKLKIKTEIVDGTVDEEMVPHRKSDRRRVARDIFFLIEEYPTHRNRKAGKAGGKSNTKKLRGRPKSKFSHLRASNSESILRHQDNKATVTKIKKQLPTSMRQDLNTLFSRTNQIVPTPINSIKLPIAKPSLYSLPRPHNRQFTSCAVASCSGETTPARVNPIFLWVKQDDTRIVEVRCEDYDKRNRIRLTKTSSGWKAIPRTDPTSSRISKLPNTFIKIKKERKDNLNRLETIETTSTDSFSANAQFPNNEFCKKKKKKQKKQKKQKRHIRGDDENTSTETLSTEKQMMLSSGTSDQLISPNHTVDTIYESSEFHQNDTEVFGETSSPVIEEVNSQKQDREHLLEKDSPVISSPHTEKDKSAISELTIMDGDDIEMHIPQFTVHHLDKEFDGQQVVYGRIENYNINEIDRKLPTLTTPNTNENQHTSSDSFIASDVDTNQLKDLLDDADLLQHCDNALSGAELIDSLVKRGYEDNHISDDYEQHSNQENKSMDVILPLNKNAITTCLKNNFDNEKEEPVMTKEPSEDIISRLGRTMTSSPKCLSFNEAGEIEDLHGELFQVNNQSDPYNRTALEELSITFKHLEKSNETYLEQALQNHVDSNSESALKTDCVVDESPKDLTCKKSNTVPLENSNNFFPDVITNDSINSNGIRPAHLNGMSAVQASPDLLHHKSKPSFFDELFNINNSISPKLSSPGANPAQINTSTLNQNTQSDLGNHMKTETQNFGCSKVTNLSNPAERVVDNNGNKPIEEPATKRKKRELTLQNKAHAEKFVEMTLQGEETTPLIQLKLLLAEWNIPDPLLVPKDRLNAILASPAREIMLLLTERPELRLPEAFAYPNILQDPDILVISMTQLECILQKQVDIFPKLKPAPVQPQVTIELVSGKILIDKPIKHVLTTPELTEILSPQKCIQTKVDNLLNPLASFLSKEVSSEIDIATIAAFNKMLWLPYMTHMAPDLMNVLAEMRDSNAVNGLALADQLSLFTAPERVRQLLLNQTNQKQKSDMGHLGTDMSTMGLPMAGTAAHQIPSAIKNNQIQIALLQEALNRAEIQQTLKLGQAAAQQDEKQKEYVSSAQRNSAAILAAQKTAEYLKLSSELQKLQEKTLKSRPMIGINPFRQEHNRTQLRNLSTTPTSNFAEKLNAIPSLNPFHQNYINGGLEISPVIRKTKKNLMPVDRKPRVTCKSLTNFFSPNHEGIPNVDKNNGNLTGAPWFNLNLAAATHPFQFQNMGGNAPTHNHQQHKNNIQEKQGPKSSSSTNLCSNEFNWAQCTKAQEKPQQRGKLKVKSKSHLLDPAAIKRHLLNCDEVPEVSNTTSSLNEAMNVDPNAGLWHPLFGSSQKAAYKSPWQWTTVTATDE